MSLATFNGAGLRWIGYSLLVFSSTTFANPRLPSTMTWNLSAQETLPDWLRHQSDISTERLLDNIGPEDAHPGAVVAAPSRQDPDYFFHWVRDAALVMDTVISLYESTENQPLKDRLERILFHYVDLSRQNQTSETPSGDRGLGEPKFHADGTVFWGPWGRPQNDGPALRAITLARFAEILLDQGREQEVLDKFYRSELPAHTVIKADLEYVSHHWREASFDLWEEVSGHHFYTQMVQRRALVEGARLAHRLGDRRAAAWYESQIPEISKDIEGYWNPESGFIITTKNRVEGIDYKYSGIDSAVILGVLHGYAHDGFFAPQDPRVISTAVKIEQAFRRLYPINQKPEFPGTAIGRYPEDRYTGYHSNGEGNPWILNTNAFAELYYRAAKAARQSGSHDKAVVWARHGDSFLARNRVHANPDGSLSEQINRYNGYLQGAPNLTWSHASFLTAVWARP